MTVFAKDLESIKIMTAKGAVTYKQIETEVFKPMGYEIVESEVPIPRLVFTKEPTCEQINTEWLRIAENTMIPKDPPKEITPALLPAFNLNGHALLSQVYMNDKTVSSPRIWDQIENWMTVEDPRSIVTYGEKGMAVYHAMKYMGMSGQIGVVVGSVTPWIEVLALRNGAKEILTVEYQNTTIIGSDRIKYIHPFDFARDWRNHSAKYDFIVSFSSLEHSGLQRYGDPEDPIGDIREMLKLRCAVKHNGLMYVGMPRGQDHLVYNVHRIYGRIRLAIMFAGFDLIAVFRGDNAKPIAPQVEDFDGVTRIDGDTQDLWVLRRI